MRGRTSRTCLGSSCIPVDRSCTLLSVLSVSCMIDLARRDTQSKMAGPSRQAGAETGNNRRA